MLRIGSCELGEVVTYDIHVVITRGGNLDPLGRRDMMNKISQRVAEEVSVLFSSHVTLRAL